MLLQSYFKKLVLASSLVGVFANTALAWERYEVERLARRASSEADDLYSAVRRYASGGDGRLAVRAADRLSYACDVLSREVYRYSYPENTERTFHSVYRAYRRAVIKISDAGITRDADNELDDLDATLNRLADQYDYSGGDDDDIDD